MIEPLLPVILAGGSGTRLWPLSRELYPKQFLRLVNDKTMLQNTIARLSDLGARDPYVVCNDQHRFLVAEQCREVGHPLGAIILEPVARNTAPAIALAAVEAMKDGSDPCLLVLPADHHIRDQGGFRQAVKDAVTLAAQGHLVTFGVVPEGPETGYGYIRSGKKLESGGDAALIAEFVEKPDEENAVRFMGSGDYLWNSGMFVFRASRYLDELARHRPDIHAACRKAASESEQDLDFLRPGTSFQECPSDSIDYAVMERTTDAVVLSVDIGWSDVGSWSALWGLEEKDSQGNEFRGDVVSVDTQNTFVHANKRLVSTVGVKDLVVVETADAVLVAHKDHDQDVKTVVAKLKDCLRNEHHTHTRVFRPWGSYETVEAGQRYQVKRITVNPGASLSLQKHHHRSEHWVVVRGTATVHRDGEEWTVTENESTYIPVGATHRLSNPGKMPLHLIEVQVGSYLGEDDIVRFEDQYGR